jgi:predicted anti-sigma-YlaC factor YlaD
MKCSEIQKLLYDYIKNEINYDKRQIIEKHLKICRKCQNEFEIIKKIKYAFINNLQSPSPELYKNIEKRIKKQNNLWNFNFILKPVFAVILLLFLFTGIFIYNKNTSFLKKSEISEIFYESYNIMEIENNENEIDTQYLLYDQLDL